MIHLEAEELGKRKANSDIENNQVNNEIRTGKVWADKYGWPFTGESYNRSDY